ncbi:UDP-N-acetylmuramate--L-alanine ligase [Actinotignum urinale]|uniref:UDP-N-acetylmuramate--L-alanine ligase n=1 Tax=Actinotignum urinale TaxID=190146 RepID=UPI002A8312D2|nr:UDP-N-acetylmuramate--L-alanine ligase [Actinotignum urinale]MDY5129123.1 UDP-N-acetylmuramate--L-alanine ligase [Actinotignum urinale]
MHNTEIAPYSAFYLIGMGGAGMSVVAEFLLAEGFTVAGSDMHDSLRLDELRSKGATVFIGQRVCHVPAGYVVVVSTAIKDDNPDLAGAHAQGNTVIHRSQALAFACGGRDFVAVAGAHGKTTTSGMIACALAFAGSDPSWAIGSSIAGLGSGGHLGKGGVFVAEADESDGSFLNYSPRVSLVTNVEPDHLDHYGSREAFEEVFVEFSRRLVSGGVLIVCSDDDGARRLGMHAVKDNLRVISYGRGQGVPGAEKHVLLRDAGSHTRGQGNGAGHCDVSNSGKDTGSDARSGEGNCSTIVDGFREVPLKLNVPGHHNELNAVGAWAVGVELGVHPETMAKGLETFRGTGRRFEWKGEVGGISVFDDYAHHPTEVAATLQAAREKAGEGRVLVVFQPHLYSRTRAFAKEFAKALETADVAIVAGVYGAREQPFDGIEGSTITDNMAHGRFIPDRFEAGLALLEQARPGDIVLTMGAGDITDVAPILVERLERI